MIQATATYKERLTVSNIAQLVDFAQNLEPTPQCDRTVPNLSHDRAKLAILDLFNNQIEIKLPSPLTADGIRIVDIAIEPGDFVHVIWKFTGTTMPIGNRFSVSEYLEITNEN